MSSASEESVLSVPELQETMKQLTWLASERRLGDADSEEDLSQEDEEEDEEDTPKGGEEEIREETETGDQGGGEQESPGEQENQRRTRGGSARGRGRPRPPRGLKRSRQDRISKDSSKLLLLYDENILDNDPQRESKDSAYARSYLNRVREALAEAPLKMEAFVSLLGQFSEVGDKQKVVSLFRQLQCILGAGSELLRDFAAFLRPEQALLCGLFAEQQAFERSRRFLRQLEISFGDNPAHHQKIIRALQTGPDLSPHSVSKLKSQMTSLLKGHTHLQAELWVFFDELRPPPARPGQFEEAHWPEEGEGVAGFEEVALPEPDEISQPITAKQRRKMEAQRSDKGCDWSEKSWLCLCPDSNRRKKTCPQCKGVVSRAVKSLHPLYNNTEEEQFLPNDEDDEDTVKADREDHREDDQDEEEKEESEEDNRRHQREVIKTDSSPSVSDLTQATPTEAQATPTEAQVTPSDPQATPSDPQATPTEPQTTPTEPQATPTEPSVCAKNISLTASGEKVILWTRDADRVILTRCQQDGATPTTFTHISNILKNKTAAQVSQRFQDLMRLFHTRTKPSPDEDSPGPRPGLDHSLDQGQD